MGVEPMQRPQMDVRNRAIMNKIGYQESDDIENHHSWAPHLGDMLALPQNESSQDFVSRSELDQGGRRGETSPC